MPKPIVTLTLSYINLADWFNAPTREPVDAYARLLQSTLRQMRPDLDISVETGLVTHHKFTVAGLPLADGAPEFLGEYDLLQELEPEYYAATRSLAAWAWKRAGGPQADPPTVNADPDAYRSLSASDVLADRLADQLPDTEPAALARTPTDERRLT